MSIPSKLCFLKNWIEVVQKSRRPAAVATIDVKGAEAMFQPPTDRRSLAVGLAALIELWNLSYLFKWEEVYRFVLDIVCQNGVSELSFGPRQAIWYLSPMRAAKVQASLRIRAVSPEPSLLAHTSSESRGTFRQKARSLAPLNGWACAVKICNDGMLEDTNSLDGALFFLPFELLISCLQGCHICATTRENVSSGIFDQIHSNQPVQLQKLARILKPWIKQVYISYFLSSEQQRCWSDCADAQADLHLCWSHMA